MSRVDSRLAACAQLTKQYTLGALRFVLNMLCGDSLLLCGAALRLMNVQHSSHSTDGLLPEGGMWSARHGASAVQGIVLPSHSVSAILGRLAALMVCGALYVQALAQPLVWVSDG